MFKKGELMMKCLKAHLHRLYVGAVALLIAASFAPIAALAVDESDYTDVDYYFGYAFDADENFSLAVAVNLDGQTVVYTDCNLNPEDACMLLGNDGSYTLEYAYNGDDRFYAWRVSGTNSGMLDDSIVFQAAPPVKGESAIALYRVIDSTDLSFTLSRTKVLNLRLQADNFATIEMEELDDFAFIHGSLGILLNDNGECIGLIYSGSIVALDWFDADTFYAADVQPDADPGTDSDADPGADREPSDEGSATYTLVLCDESGGEISRLEDTSDAGSATFTLPDAAQRDGYTFRGWATAQNADVSYSAGEQITLTEPGTTTLYAAYEKNAFPEWAIALVVAVVVALAAIVILLIRKSGKPRPNPTSGPDGDEGTSKLVDPPGSPPYNPMGPADPPVQPPPYGAPVGPAFPLSGLVLLCTGGYMDGRIYVVQNVPMTIGRSPSCAIRYPADTAGISREHAVLYWQAGKLMLRDMSSDVTGTYLKRKGDRTYAEPLKMVNGQSVKVEVGDIFYIGERCNCFEIANK